MTPNSYPDLVQFFGCYFHQDFLSEFDNAEGALNEFLAEEPNEWIRSTLAELDLFFEHRPDEETAERLLSELGCVYFPPADGIAVLDWMHHLRNRLRSIVHATKEGR